MIIGGVANLIWGKPRTTVDIDLTVWVDAAREKSLTEELLAAYAPIVTNAAAFAAETRILPLSVLNIRTDIAFGGVPFEENAILRSVDVNFSGANIRVCTAEDLIIHKIISPRPKDSEDIRGIIQHRGTELDRSYLDPIIEGLARDFAQPEILEFYRAEMGKIIK